MRLSLLGFALPIVGPHFRCRTVTSGRHSLEAEIEKKARLWLDIYFVNIYGFYLIV